MPTYEFLCPNGHRFDRFYRKISDAVAELPCPQCGAVALRQVSGGAGLLFKGSGFYITDYGKDGKKQQRAASGEGKSGESGGTGAEAKPSEAKSSGSGGGEGTGSGESGASSGAKKPESSTSATPPKKE
ncbi:MAG TPA: FmdB family zinc ribbon protein [Gemmatimonadaceae bacterium]|nr:FmdB family zinc ribbon protein [Gemmatimonadaceae bacterium]